MDDILPCGARAGAWRVERLIGAGGMGDVYAVVHGEIGKRAAMKVLHARLAAGIDAERVQIEGQVVNHVCHPNIVDIFDAGIVAGRPYLVMERLEGVTLAQYAAHGKVMPGRAIEILLQLCDALRAAHAAGIVHRDLKPDNVFLAACGAPTPQVKLLDWGIAKVLSETDRRTIEGCVIGTPDYMAPEQACGRPVSPATDVYALAVVAFQLFTEALPFEAVNAMDMLTKHVNEPPLEPSELWPEIPLRLEQLLLAMLAKRPPQRPSIDTVARQLELVQDELDERYRGERRGRVPPMRARSRRSANDVALPAPATPRPAAAVGRGIRTAASPRYGLKGLLLAAGVFATGLTTVAVSRWRAAADPPSRMDVRASAQLLPTPLPMAPTPIAMTPTPIAMTPPPRPRVAQEVLTVEEKSVMQPRRVGAPARSGPKRRASVASGVASAVAPTRACAGPDASGDERCTPAAADLVVMYEALARELADGQPQIEVSDLWSRFRLIRIYDELGTAARRSRTAAALASIRGDMAARRGALVTPSAP